MGRLKIKSLIKRYVKAMTPINVVVNNVTLSPNELLQKKTAIVTGASRGIGKAIAKTMINSGATVIALGRNMDTLNKTKDEFNSDKYIPYICDVADVEHIDNHFETICSLAPGGNIDILVNCAGVKNGNDERFFDFTPEEFDYVVDTNLRATFFWCQIVAKHMIDKKIRGHIVNVISIKGFIGEASPYSVSKWGITSLTKGLARKLAPEGIIVNGLAPGGTKTDMAHLEDDSMLHLATPSMRLADPNEMANMVLFLASDLGNNIVGDVIISDGGQILQYGNKME